jgi:pimeloyl-ACP methyl ester carboxylesterase
MARFSNIVFVHGAWANASAWSKVLPLLAGVNAVAISLPLTSLGDDVATVHRAVALMVGPTLLVGHSYGGAVITQAGINPQVKGLLYIAAFAPDIGENVIQLGGDGPPTELPQVLVPDKAGFLKLSRRGVDEVFAQDLPLEDRTIIFQSQSPTAAAALGAPLAAAAWRDKPSWYLRATGDRTIHPDLQATMSTRMGATTINVVSSHLPMLTQPQAVAAFIRLILQ